jgi:hypothetical protein
MDSKSKSKSFPRREAITAALEPSLLSPLIGLVCEYSSFGPFELFHSHGAASPAVLLARSPVLSHSLTCLFPPPSVCPSVCRQLCCTERKDAEPTRIEPPSIWGSPRQIGPARITHTDRHLFVGDQKSHSILVYSLERDLALVREIGSEGDGAGQFDDPHGMCIYRDRLIVCDNRNSPRTAIDCNLSICPLRTRRIGDSMRSSGRTASGETNSSLPMTSVRPVTCCSSLSVPTECRPSRSP